MATVSGALGAFCDRAAMRSCRDLKLSRVRFSDDSMCSTILRTAFSSATKPGLFFRLGSARSGGLRDLAAENRQAVIDSCEGFNRLAFVAFNAAQNFVQRFSVRRKALFNRC